MPAAPKMCGTPCQKGCECVTAQGCPSPLTAPNAGLLAESLQGTGDSGGQCGTLDCCRSVLDIGEAAESSGRWLQVAA